MDLGAPKPPPLAAPPPPGPNPLDKANAAADAALRKMPKRRDRSSLLIDPAVPAQPGAGVNVSTAY